VPSVVILAIAPSFHGRGNLHFFARELTPVISNPFRGEKSPKRNTHNSPVPEASGFSEIDGPGLVLYTTLVMPASSALEILAALKPAKNPGMWLRKIFIIPFSFFN
jgi:hypothetical protein